MVYTSPSKVSWIIELRRLGFTQANIGTKIGVHHTTVSRILKRFRESRDVYFIRPKPGRPRKLTERQIRLGARMLARVEASNATELAKKAFPNVSRQTVARSLKEYGLICRVRKTQPFISHTNQKKAAPMGPSLSRLEGRGLEKGSFLG